MSVIFESGLNQPPAEWVQLTEADAVAVTFQNVGTAPAFVKATVGASKPTSTVGSIEYPGGAKETNVLLADLFPGISGGNRLWAYSNKPTSMFMSHAPSTNRTVALSPAADFTTARIAHANNWLDGGTVTASSTATDFFANGPTNGLTYEKWKPSSLTATWEYDHGSAAECDYCAIGAHTMGTNRNTLQVQYWDGSVWVDLVPSSAITSDEPIMAFFTPQTRQRWRVRIQGFETAKYGSAVADYTQAAVPTVLTNTAGVDDFALGEWYFAADALGVAGAGDELIDRVEARTATYVTITDAALGVALGNTGTYDATWVDGLQVTTGRFTDAYRSRSAGTLVWYFPLAAMTLAPSVFAASDILAHCAAAIDRGVVGPRQDSAAYTANTLVQFASGKVFFCNIAGTTGGTAPSDAGATTAGDFLSDGTVTWEYTGLEVPTAWNWWLCDFESNLLTVLAPDSHDAYAGMLAAAVEAGSADATWLNAASAHPGLSRMDVIDNLIRNCITDELNGTAGGPRLALTFQGSVRADGSAYNIRFLADNVECWRGLTAQAALHTTLGNTTEAADATAFATDVKAGVLNLFDDVAGRFRAFEGETGYETQSGEQDFTDRIRFHLWPVLHGMLGPDEAPEIGVIKFGKALQMQRPLYGGHAPIPMARQTIMRSNKSETGEFLGRSKQRTYLATTYEWQHLTAGWVRTNWPDFQKAIEESPFFIAWRPATFGDVALCQSNETPIPVNMGIRDLMSVALNVRARGYD